MTTSYEDTGEFVAAVRQLADPLSDPLPGASSAGHPVTSADSVGGARSESKSESSPWFRSTEQTAHPEPGGYEPYEYGTGYAAEAAYPQSAPHAWQGRDAYAQPYAPAPAYEPQSQPVARPEQEAVPAPRRARSGLTQTAQLPVVEPDQAPELAFTPGGRAARRKAAKRSSGRRFTGPATASPVSSASLDGAAARSAPVEGVGSPMPKARGGRRAGNPATPRTRMEARRAARAAKDPPMMVVSRVAGEAFITIGMVMLLFVVYQLWWTNVLADEAANGAASNLEHQWAGTSVTSDANMPNHFAEGQSFAIIYLPKLDVSAPIAEGVNKDTILDKGEVGHYSGSLETAFPWDKTGNFALAAHRNTHGEPFRYINKLVPGDKVVVETSSTYYTYEITSTLPQTSPANIGVIRPIPQGSGFTTPGRYITLTTCTPEFTSLYRLIVWGKMVGEQPRSKGTPAALAS